MANKTCKSCKQTKPVSDFYKTKHNSDEQGYDYYCKYCRNGSHLKSVRENKKRCSLDDCNSPHYAKGYCRKHYARIGRNGTTVSKNKLIGLGDYLHKGKKVSDKKHRLKLQYKLTLQEFIKRSKNGCEICGYKPERVLHVDHDHSCCPSEITCGECVRGVICNRCNAAVDKMENNIIRPDYPNYQLIKEYLEAYSGKKG